MSGTINFLELIKYGEYKDQEEILIMMINFIRPGFVWLEQWV